MGAEQEAEIRLREALRDGVRQLLSANARDEVIAVYLPERRSGLIRKKARFITKTRAWRLGPILLDADARLYQVGESTRAAAPRHPGYQSESAEERRIMREVAFRSGMSEKDTINYSVRVIDVEPGFLETDHTIFRFDQGVITIQIQPHDHHSAWVDVHTVLADRIALLSGSGL